MPASPSSLIAALSNAPASLCAQELAIDLPAALARLPDPRARRGIRHQLVVVVTAAVCAVVAGYRSYTAIGEWVADLPADALHCQRDHVAYLASRGAYWILTVKGNQPSLYLQLAGLPWRLVPDADRDTARGHGRREIRTLKILSVSTGIDFPHAAQAIQIRRRRRRLDQPRSFTTETVYAITDLQAHQAKPWQLADWIPGHWSIENKTHWVRDVTFHDYAVLWVMPTGDAVGGVRAGQGVGVGDGRGII